MTAEEEIFKKVATEFFYHWWNTEGNNTSYGFDMWWEQKGKQLVKNYHKESSKELVEACKLALYFCERRQMPTELELIILGIDLRKALENHLK